jgi:hypothetical protein
MRSPRVCLRAVAGSGIGPAGPGSAPLLVQGGTYSRVAPFARDTPARSARPGPPIIEPGFNMVQALEGMKPAISASPLGLWSRGGIMLDRNDVA